MDTTPEKSLNWPGAEAMQSTSDPNLTMSEITEEVPSLAVATVAGLVAFMLIAIAAVFLLGVFIDCRQQRIMEKKMGEVKRLKNQRKVNINSEDDSASIAHNMEQPGRSAPPAEVVAHIP